jgi:hypothetical protein
MHTNNIEIIKNTDSSIVNDMGGAGRKRADRYILA